MVARANRFMMRFRRRKKKNKEKKAAAAAAAAAAAEQTVDSDVSCTDLTASGQGKISVTGVVSVDTLHARNTWGRPEGNPYIGP